MSAVSIGTRPLSWKDYEDVVYHGATVTIADRDRISRHRAALTRRLDAGAVIYSVNTGYGAEAGNPIPADALAQMQVNTITSHAIGFGPLADEAVSRGMLLLIAQSAAQGPPALRIEIVDALVRALNERRHPPIPSIGSHSASDLVPCAHLALGLLASEPRLTLEAKEGSLANNSAFCTALAAAAVRAAIRLIDAAEEVAAMTLQAIRGYPEAFDERLVALRPHPGALQSAAHMRRLLAGSTLLRGPGRPHDPFSLRCLPQVHGAIRDAVAHAHTAVRTELCSVSDNPIVLTDGTSLSGGNFHGAPIGLPIDGVSLALGELATMSAQRTRLLVAGTLGTPPKLTTDPVRRQGLLMAPAVAGALVAECRQRGAPASRESIPTDLMEDHVSMAALAARQAIEVATLARRVLAVELTCAAQALDLTGTDGASFTALQLHANVRSRLAFIDEDQPIDFDVLLDVLAATV